MRIKLHDVEVAEVMSELMEENCPGVVWLSEVPEKPAHESEHMKQVYRTLSRMMAETRPSNPAVAKVTR